MAENSQIEWCDHTFNPWIGCTKVSAGGPEGVRVRTSVANWKKPLKWNEQAKAARRRFSVFCASLADVFEDKPDQPEMDEWRRDLFALIDATPNLDWLLLTKRPENVQRLWPFGWYDEQFTWPNVRLGTSVENQEQADKRIPELLQIPAKNFLSMEPLLGPVDIEDWLYERYGCGGEFANRDCAECSWQLNTIDWVIVGGESGPNARPMHPNWARSLRDQCQEAGVPFFFKQWGEWSPDCICGRKNICQTVDRPKPGSNGVMFRCGKKRAGRLLDSREWNEFPEVTD